MIQAFQFGQGKSNLGVIKVESFPLWSDNCLENLRLLVSAEMSDQLTYRTSGE